MRSHILTYEEFLFLNDDASSLRFKVEVIFFCEGIHELANVLCPLLDELSRSDRQGTLLGLPKIQTPRFQGDSWWADPVREASRDYKLLGDFRIGALGVELGQSFVRWAIEKRIREFCEKHSVTHFTDLQASADWLRPALYLARIMNYKFDMAHSTIRSKEGWNGEESIGRLEIFFKPVTLICSTCKKPVPNFLC